MNLAHLRTWDAIFASQTTKNIARTNFLLLAAINVDGHHLRLVWLLI